MAERQDGVAVVTQDMLFKAIVRVLQRRQEMTEGQCVNWVGLIVNAAVTTAMQDLLKELTTARTQKEQQE